MKQYVCDKGHLFLFPAVRTTMEYEDVATSITVSQSIMKISFERHVCPYCESPDISEAPEEQITSVVSVDISEVDAKLKEGYVVENLYQKTATLVKLEAKQR